MAILAHVDADHGVRDRTELLCMIRAEYREMPGLSVTLEQAARLWHTERRHCLEVLEELTAEGFLYRCRERYLRASDERRCCH